MMHLKAIVQGEGISALEFLRFEADDCRGEKVHHTRGDSVPRSGSLQVVADFSNRNSYIAAIAFSAVLERGVTAAVTVVLIEGELAVAASGLG